VPSKLFAPITIILYALDQLAGILLSIPIISRLSVVLVGEVGFEPTNGEQPTFFT